MTTVNIVMQYYGKGNGDIKCVLVKEQEGLRRTDCHGMMNHQRKTKKF